jgi:glycosyltransferase involved in cell wall biosynthesis
LRVLIAHNRYRSAGGEERHVELLERGLREAGVEVHRFERQGAELAQSPVRRLIAGVTLAYRPGAGGIGRVLREWQPSVVHFHNTWPLLTPSALRAAKRGGAAVVFTAHNYRFACPGGTLMRNGQVHQDCVDGSSLRCGLGNPRGNRVESLAYGIALEVQRRLRMLRRWVHAFVAPSEFMSAMLVRSGLPRERVHVIRPGLPVPSQPPTPPGRFALYLGRLAPEKGIRTLLSAAHIEPTVPIAVAGDGPLAPEVHAQGAVTEYLGRLDRRGVEAALRRAAFTVIPSECYENSPLSALESLAAGRGVVATRIGGLPELIDDGVTGVLVPPGDATALATSMSKLSNDAEQASQMGRAARRTAEHRFALESQTARLIDLYDELRSARDSS